MDGQDDRLGQTEGTTVRRPQGRPPLRRDNADERILAERGQQEREIAEDRELNETERLEMFRASQYQSVLPDLPSIPGYHTIWLTTTNARDSIPRRLRLGYRLIRVEDCPGWEGIGVKTVDYAGIVAVEEMVAAKIKLDTYNLYMKEAHHTQPLQEEEKLRAQTRALQDEAQERGTIIEEGDGTANIVQRARPMPDFSA